LLGEERSKSSIFTYIQGLQETLTNFTPRSKTESRRVSIAREQLREIKRRARQASKRGRASTRKVKCIRRASWK
jgi:hypothetical protein